MLTTQQALQQSIQHADNGLTLADLLRQHPALARRTAQRLIAALLEEELIIATGQGRARRYFAKQLVPTNGLQTTDRFPAFIPLSADSLDILAYVGKPTEARIPVGYQSDFLGAYQPNKDAFYRHRCAGSYIKSARPRNNHNLQAPIAGLSSIGY